MSRTRPAWLMVVAACLVGLLLRLAFLGSKGFWLDETLSIALATEPRRLLAGGFDHTHPPLYYMLLHYWLPVGASEFALRLSSVLTSTLAIPLSYLLARELGGRKVATSTLWLVTFAPLLVWYAQELRSYSLLTLLGLVVAIALTRLLATPNLLWWLLFVTTMSATLYTHYAALLLVLAQPVIIAVLHLQSRLTRRGLWLWLAAGPAILLLYAPWLTAPGMSAFVRLLLTSNLYPIEMLALDLNLSPTLVSIALIVLGMAIFGAALVIAWRLLRLGSAVWNQWAASPFVRYGILLLFVIATIISVYPRIYTIKKLIVALWPYGLMVVAWVFPWDFPRKVPQKRLNRVPLIALLVISLTGSLVNVTLIPKDGWRDLAAYLLTHAAPADRAWVVPRYQGVPLDYYLTHPDLIPSDASVSASQPAATVRLAPVDASMSDAELAELAADGQRVWLIYHTTDYQLSDPARRLERWLMAHFEHVMRIEFHRIEATLYAPKP